MLSLTAAPGAGEERTPGTGCNGASPDPTQLPAKKAWHAVECAHQLALIPKGITVRASVFDVSHDTRVHDGLKNQVLKHDRLVADLATSSKWGRLLPRSTKRAIAVSSCGRPTEFTPMFFKAVSDTAACREVSARERACRSRFSIAA